jgi:hypothetical protein
MNEAEARRLVLVLGVGRSGTSLITGILGQLGFHIPQPEISADETNPRGFGEPAWVVSFHTELMRRHRVTVFDARPAAWEVTARAASDPAVQRELREWLQAQLDQSDPLAVKDPRIAWFLPLWLGCLAELGVPHASITMLRHPAEILTSARRWYGTWQTDASRAAAWLNVMLETERATRLTPRAFLRYERLLSDWRSELGRAWEMLGRPRLSGIERERLGEVDRLVDPGLRRSRVGWEGIAVPASVRDLAEETWKALQLHAEATGDTAPTHDRLDSLRSAYVSLYEEAESIAQSSLTAVKPKRKSKGGTPAAAGLGDAKRSSSPRLRRWLVQRIPKRYRGPLRAAASALRRPR